MLLISFIFKIQLLAFLCSFTIMFAQDNKTIYIYDEHENMNKNFWQPSFWMNPKGISFQSNFSDHCHLGKTCIEIGFYPEKESWAAIYWVAYDSRTGPGINIYKYYNTNENASIIISFWAKGEIGGENARFKVGGIKRKGKETEWIQLSNEWKEYEIDLSEIDLSDLIGGFCWETNFQINRRFLETKSKKEVLIYLDDIKFVIN